MADKPLILFAGGGSGGHIFPNMAVAEQLREHGVDFRAHYLTSDRSLDHKLMAAFKLDYTPLLVQPFSDDLFKWWSWYRSWKSSIKDVNRLLKGHDVRALIATGGFVSGPPVVACSKTKIPIVLVNLDAVAGKANRLAAKHATTIFSAYENAMERAHYIGLPLRRSAIGPKDKPLARRQLGLEPNRETLLVVGGSQGAASINKAVSELVIREDVRSILSGGWQILHLTGGKDGDNLEEHYRSLAIPAKVVPFYAQMGLAWSSASLAISRSGAGSVAEAWVNATPCIFMPYPHHKDDQQRLNAEPMVQRKAAIIVQDQPDNVPATVDALYKAALPWLNDRAKLMEVSRSLAVGPPPDGAVEIAEWLLEILHE